MQREFEIIFCLDCSTDNSIEIIEKYKNQCHINILPLEHNRGLGIAYKKAFLHVIFNAKADDIIVSFDADCTHNPSQLQEMLKTFDENNLDFMVASRFVNKSSIQHFPLYRKLISKAISLYLQSLFPIKNKKNNSKIKDYTSGYRIYKNDVLQKLYKIYGLKFLSEKDFTCLIEILIKLNKSHLIDNCAEFPIQYEYGEKIGASKLRLSRNFYRLLILSFKLLK